MSRYGNVKVGNGAQQLDQIFGIERFFLIAGRLVTTQGNDAADTAVPIVFGNLTQLVRAGIDTGQVGAASRPVSCLMRLTILCVRSRSPEFAP